MEAAKTIVLDDKLSQIISLDEIMGIVEKAVHLFNVTNMMNSQSGSSSTVQYKFFPFMGSVSCLFFGNIHDTDPAKIDCTIAA